MDRAISRRRSVPLARRSTEAFADVVRSGSLQQNGMPKYAHLTDEQLFKIRHYVRREAEKSLPRPD